jgi:hypothetical protein
VAESLGEQFAQAVAAKDNGAVLELLHADLDFRAMTPNRIWEAEQAQDVIDALNYWFEDGDTVEQVVHLDTDQFADRERVGYRLRISNADGVYLVDQQAYLSERDGKISWLRIMCAGSRPIE